MKWFPTMILGFALSGAALAQPCNGAIEKKIKFSNAAAADIFVVEAFGANCADAKLVIYIKTAEQGWHALHIGELTNFASEEVKPARLQATLKDIAGRIETATKLQFETWEQLQRAGTQPNGAPWRGTQLSKAEYEKLRLAKPRGVIVPTDAARGTLYIWAENDFLGRPVAFVHYGD